MTAGTVLRPALGAFLKLLVAQMENQDPLNPMDGTEFTRRYRDQEQEGHLPIVALTANAAEDARDECLAAGMDDFLTKPVNAAELRARISAGDRIEIGWDVRAGNCFEVQ